MSFKVWTCAKCIYYSPWPKEDWPKDYAYGGECRRMAPKPADRKQRHRRPLVGYADQEWPFVTETDWCGEWRAR